MSDHTHDTPSDQYNVFTVNDNDLGELFTIEVANNGVYLDHNWSEGCLYISHENFEDLDSFRKEFLREIPGSPDHWCELCDGRGEVRTGGHGGVSQCPDCQGTGRNS